MDAEPRDHGIARRLLETVENPGRRHGLRLVALRTRVERVDSHHACAALGFVKTGESAHSGHDHPGTVTMRKPIRREL